MKDWNPGAYLKFHAERTRPAVDLVTRIQAGPDPETIIDIGCGPGNSTRVLADCWPNARITGMDSSKAMIDKARKDMPDLDWIVGDAANFAPDVPCDLVFSNAVIQWIPDHETLMARFRAMLTEAGMLAVQIPLFWDMPLGQLIRDAAGQDRWKHQTDGIFELFTIHDSGFYYDTLSDLFSRVDIWETRYVHALDSHEAMVEMMRSTGLKPYLERLADDRERTDFEADVLDRIRRAYPARKNGQVLLAFHRLFFIGANG